MEKFNVSAKPCIEQLRELVPPEMLPRFLGGDDDSCPLGRPVPPPPDSLRHDNFEILLQEGASVGESAPMRDPRRETKRGRLKISKTQSLVLRLAGGGSARDGARVRVCFTTIDTDFSVHFSAALLVTSRAQQSMRTPLLPETECAYPACPPRAAYPPRRFGLAARVPGAECARVRATRSD